MKYRNIGHIEASPQKIGPMPEIELFGYPIWLWGNDVKRTFKKSVVVRG